MVRSSREIKTKQILCVERRSRSDHFIHRLPIFSGNNNKTLWAIIHFYSKGKKNVTIIVLSCQTHLKYCDIDPIVILEKWKRKNLNWNEVILARKNSIFSSSHLPCTLYFHFFFDGSRTSMYSFSDCWGEIMIYFNGLPVKQNSTPSLSFRKIIVFHNVIRGKKPCTLFGCIIDTFRFPYLWWITIIKHKTVDASNFNNCTSKSQKKNGIVYIWQTISWAMGRSGVCYQYILCYQLNCIFTANEKSWRRQNKIKNMSQLS